MERRVDREARAVGRKSNHVAYLADKMENTCDKLQYDPAKTPGENLKEHQEGRKLLDGADHENFLSPAAAEAAGTERDFQSHYWFLQRRTVKGEDGVVWLPNVCKLERLAAGGKQRRKAAMQSMAEQLEGSTRVQHPKEPLHRELIGKAVEEVKQRHEAASDHKREQEQAAAEAQAVAERAAATAAADVAAARAVERFAESQGSEGTLPLATDGAQPAGSEPRCKLSFAAD